MNKMLVRGAVAATVTAAVAGCVGLVGDFPVGDVAPAKDGSMDSPGRTDSAADSGGSKDGPAPVDAPDAPSTDGGTDGPPRDVVVQIAAGGDSACAVTKSGALYCWGTNTYGSVGDGTTALRPSAVLITKASDGSALVPMAQVSAGLYFACAAATDKSVWCWGSDAPGSLGDGVQFVNDASFTQFDQHAPQKVPGVTAAFVATGFFHACTPTANAYVCWGSNSGGEIGHAPGTMGDQPAQSFFYSYFNSTPQVGASVPSSTQASLGLDFSCANATFDNTIRCWGMNETGQLGSLEAGSGPTPVVVQNGPNSFDFNGISVAASLAFYHACGIDAQGNVWCWGSAGSGQLGLAVNVGQGVHSYAVTVLTGMAAVASGFLSSCATDAAGRVQCWGGNVRGELGHDPATDPIQSCPDNDTPCNPNPTFVKAASGSDFDGVTQVSIGIGYTCALRNDATVWCWGANAGGALGNGAGGNDAGPSFAPVQVVGLP